MFTSSIRSVIVVMAVLGATAGAFAALPRVTLTTSAGDIVIELRSDAAPLAARAFLLNCERSIYDGTLFDSTDGGAVFGGVVVPGGSVKPANGARPSKRELSRDLVPVRGAVAFRPVSNGKGHSDHYGIVVLCQDRPEDAGLLNVLGYVVSGLDILETAAKSADADGKLNRPVELISTQISR